MVSTRRSVLSSPWYECRCLTGSTRGSFILNVEPGLQGLNVDYLSTRQIFCFGILSVDWVSTRQKLNIYELGSES